MKFVEIIEYELEYMAIERAWEKFKSTIPNLEITHAGMMLYLKDKNRPFLYFGDRFKIEKLQEDFARFVNREKGKLLKEVINKLIAKEEL